MIIDRYIIREVLKPLLTISAVLIVIFVGYSSGRYLSYAVDGLLQLDTLVSFILIKMVIALEVLLPISLYLSIVLGLGRLESHSEIVVVRASGIGNARVMIVVLCISCLLAMVVACFSIFGRPLAYEQSYWLKAQAEAEIELDKLESSNFYDSDRRERTIFVEDVDKEAGRLKRIFIRGERNGVIHIIYAQSGQQDFDEESGQRLLVLSDAHVYFLGPRGSTDKVVAKFKHMKLRLNNSDSTSVGYKRKAASTFHLARSDQPLDIAEYQWRLSTPVSTVLLAILAVIVSRTAPRSSRYIKIIGAVLVYVIYYNLTAMARAWVEADVVGKFPGIWWAQFGLVILIVSLSLYPRWSFRRAANKTPIRPGKALFYRLIRNRRVK